MCTNVAGGLFFYLRMELEVPNPSRTRVRAYSHLYACALVLFQPRLTVCGQYV